MHSRDVLQKYPRSLNEISSVIDIGSSNGEFSTNLKDLVPQSTRFISIDPIDYTNDTFEIPETYNFAVGATCEETEFWVSDFLQESSKSKLKGKRTYVEQKRMECFIDSLPFDLGEKILVKIDIQGSDLEALLGFGPYLQYISILQIEVWMRPFGKVDGTYFNDFICELNSMGFFVAEIFDLIYRAKDSKLGQVDLLCLSKDSLEYRDTDWA